MTIEELRKLVGDEKFENLTNKLGNHLNETNDIFEDDGNKFVAVISEREDEYYKIVFKVNDDPTLFMFTGAYDSYNGTNFDYCEIYECVAQEVVKTIYVAKC